MKNVNEQYCISNTEESDMNKPLVINDSSYEYYSHNKNNTGFGQLTVWKLENSIHNDQCNENNRQERTNSNEDKGLNNEQCICLNAWKKLREIFELNDEDLKKNQSCVNVFPGDNFYTMNIDLESDNCGESLRDFQLDEEYIPTSDFSSIDQHEETITSVRANEPKVQLVNKVNSDLKNNMIEATKNENTESDDVIHIEEKKINKVKYNNDNIKRVKKKKLLKTPKNLCKYYMKIKPTKKPNIEKEYDGYNIKYVPSGDSYRGGIICGHKNCVDGLITIPRNKGWITESFLDRQRDVINELKMERRRLEGEKQSNVVAAAENTVKEPQRMKQVKTNVVAVRGNTETTTTTTVKKSPAASAAAGKEPISPAAPLFGLKKTGDEYTITMNHLSTVTGGAQELDSAAVPEQPVVFRLRCAPRRGSDVESADSGSESSFDLKFGTPKPVIRRRTERHDQSTTYDAADFTVPGDKKKSNQAKSKNVNIAVPAAVPSAFKR